MRKRSLTKTRKWSMYRAGAGGPPLATACTWVVTTGGRGSPRVLGTCSMPGVCCAGRPPVSLEGPSVAWPSLSFQRPCLSSACVGTYSPCLVGTRFGGKVAPLPSQVCLLLQATRAPGVHGWRMAPCTVNPHVCSSSKGQASGSAGRSWVPPAGAFLFGSWLLDAAGPLDSVWPPRASWTGQLPVGNLHSSHGVRERFLK